MPEKSLIRSQKRGKVAERDRFHEKALIFVSGISSGGL
jgi:hypothetical protein